MPPSVTFTRELIVKAACELVEEQGWEALTARNVATKLSSSTAPIYSCFSSIQELQQVVIEKARTLLVQYTHQMYTPLPFLNQGTGIIVFAREHQQYFRLLLLSPDIAPTYIPSLYNQLIEDMKRDTRFANFTNAERALILEKLWFVAIGMATLVFNEQLFDNSNDYIIRTLGEAGAWLIPDAIAKIQAQHTQ